MSTLPSGFVQVGPHRYARKVTEPKIAELTIPPRGVSIAKPRMNKLENAWAVQLEMQRAAGLIQRWEYEAVRLRLADDTYFTPDFYVEIGDRIRFDETKGFMREAARVRLNVAARLYPRFTFRLIRRRLMRDGGGWEIIEVLR